MYTMCPPGCYRTGFMATPELGHSKSKQTNKQTNKDGVRATTAQLNPGRDTFEFDQGHVTKNQPFTVLILLSESIAI